MNESSEYPASSSVLDFLRKAAARIPFIASIFKRLAEKHKEIALRAHAEGKTAIAIAHFSRAITFDPTNCSYLNNLAYVRFLENDLPAAVQLYRQALNIDYSNSEALKGIAYSLDLMGHREDAIYYYFLAIQANPNNAGLYNNLLSTLEKAGKFDEVITNGERALKGLPNNVDIVKSLARSYCVLGKFDLASERLTEALRVEPNDSEMHRLLGIALSAKGDIKAAVQSFAKAVKANDKNMDAYLGLCSGLQQTGRNAEALDAALKMRDIAKSEGDSYDLFLANWAIGWAHYKLSNWRASADASEEAVKLIDSAPIPRFNLALAHLRLGSTERAWSEYRFASNQSAQEELNEAIDDLKAALTEEPALLDAKEILDMLVLKLNETKRDKVAELADRGFSTS